MVSKYGFRNQTCCPYVHVVWNGNHLSVFSCSYPFVIGGGGVGGGGGPNIECKIEFMNNVVISLQNLEK